MHLHMFCKVIWSGDWAWKTITYTRTPHTNMTNHNLHMHTTSHKHEKPLLGHTHTQTWETITYTHTQKQSPHRYHTNTPTHEKPFLRHTNMRNPYTHTHTHTNSHHTDMTQTHPPAVPWVPSPPHTEWPCRPVSARRWCCPHPSGPGARTVPGCSRPPTTPGGNGVSVFLWHTLEASTGGNRSVQFSGRL